MQRFAKIKGVTPAKNMGKINLAKSAPYKDDPYNITHLYIYILYELNYNWKVY